MSIGKNIRKIHYLATLFVVLPLFVILISGTILMLKKQSDWIQPKTQKGISNTPTLSFDDILTKLKTVDTLHVESFKDIKRIDVRPSKGIAKIQLKDNIEVQIDTSTGDILQVATRRSGVIEDLHTGDYFGSFVKYGVFLLASVVLFIQLLSGIYLFAKPILLKKQRKNNEN